MRLGPAALLLVAAFCAPSPSARGAEAPAPAAPGAASDPGGDAGDLDAGRRRLRDAMDAATRAAADRRAAEEGLGALRADRARLAAALIAASARVRAAEERASAAEDRLRSINARDGAIRASLLARRGQIADVLAALQRAGLRPPPALLASPADALSAIRASMLLGAVVPALRTQVETLAADLAELRRLRDAAEVERDALRADVASLDADRARLGDLVAVRQSAEAQAEGRLEAERRRADALAHDASDVRDLVDRLADADAARRADAAGVEARAAMTAARAPARLAPAVPFAQAQGRLPPPVAGRTLRSFGAPDGYGGEERGLSVATRPGAVVTAPADGWVSFAGPWRSYGQLLILDVGGGYRLVLAGMAQADVATGQFVLAGEPVGLMGDGAAPAAAAIALGADGPVLYVELRRDGAAIDPDPWWAKAEAQKVRG